MAENSLRLLARNSFQQRQSFNGDSTLNRAPTSGREQFKAQYHPLLRVIRLRYLLRFTGADITLVIGYLLKARNARGEV